MRDGILYSAHGPSLVVTTKQQLGHSWEYVNRPACIVYMHLHAAQAMYPQNTESTVQPTEPIAQVTQCPATVQCPAVQCPATKQPSITNIFNLTDMRSRKIRVMVKDSKAELLVEKVLWVCNDNVSILTRPDAMITMNVFQADPLRIVITVGNHTADYCTFTQR
jgi:hypothetical protein